MKRIVGSSIGLMLLMALLMIGCATTQITANWKDPAYQGHPRKIMVVGVAKKLVLKRIFEDEFVRQFKSHGVDAVAGYTVIPDNAPGNHALIIAKMKEEGADAVLISRLVSKKTVRTQVPGSVYYPSSNYGNWRDYYGNGFQVVYAPGYTVEDEYALMESNLYDAASDKLIWSATSETELFGTNQAQIKSFIGVMVQAMVEQKIVR